MRPAGIEHSPSDVAAPPFANGARPAEPAPYQELEPPDPDLEPDPSESPRGVRTEWKLAHVAAWREHIRSLEHYDPGYRYDITHEYEADWTTDPDYGPGIALFPFNEDDFVGRQHDRHHRLQLEVCDSLNDSHKRQSRRLVSVKDLELFFKSSFHFKSKVKPDVTVRAVADIPTDRDEEDALYSIHTERGEAAPLLVVEITSPDSTRLQDLREKKALYAELGIAEYVVLDSPVKNAPYALRAFVLQADGRYGEAVLGCDADSIPNYHSAALGCPLRLQQPDAPPAGPDDPEPPAPRLQWWDASATRWCDIRTDEEYRLARSEARLARSEARLARSEAEQLETAVATLRVLAAAADPREVRRVEEFWRAHGIPDGPRVAGLVQAAVSGAADWRSLRRAALEHADGTPRSDRALDMLRNALAADPAAVERIAAHWAAHGPPADAAVRTLAVAERPLEWQAILDIPDDGPGPAAGRTPKGW